MGSYNIYYKIKRDRKVVKMFLDQIQQFFVSNNKMLDNIAVEVVVLLLIVFLIVGVVKGKGKRKFLKLKLTQIDYLSGRDFEKYLYYKLRSERYKVKLTPSSHDFGADLVLKKGTKKIIIQAKRWKDNVGISAVQEIVAAKSYYNAKYAMVITNSCFTRSAKDLANANGVILWNRYTLKKWINGKKFKQLWEETKDNVY